LPDFGGRLPRFPEDVPDLEGLVRHCGAELLVIDPLMAFLPPRVAANLDQCVRQALTPLAGLAARTGCAVVFLRHLTKTARDRAGVWLKQELATGPRPAAELYAAAAAAGIPERTLERAKAALGVSSHRTYDYTSGRGEWYWYDPDADWPGDAPFRKPSGLP